MQKSHQANALKTAVTLSHPDTFKQKRSDIRHELKINWLNFLFILT
jgi:hypothetical protein